MPFTRSLVFFFASPEGESVLVYLVMNIRDCFLAFIHVPNSIASQDQEIDIWWDLDATDVWKCSYGLILRFKQLVWLILVISKNSGKCQHPINSQVFNMANRRVNPPPFLQVARLVISWEVNCLFSLRHDCARVTSIRAVDFLGRN